MVRPFIQSIGLSVLAVASVGCSDPHTRDRPKTVSVTGVVLFAGRPLEGAQVTFRPEQEDATPAFGKTDREGRFVLTTFEQGDGAVPGRHQVKVVKRAPNQSREVVNPYDPEFYKKNPDYDPVKAADEAVKEVSSSIPERYADFGTSGLTADVQENGENEFTFELE